jgi:hypothetical protein
MLKEKTLFFCSQPDIGTDRWIGGMGEHEGHDPAGPVYLEAGSVIPLSSARKQIQNL